MSSYAARVQRNIATIEARQEQECVHSEPKNLNHARGLSKQEKRTVAHLTGTVYTVVDLADKPEVLDDPREQRTDRDGFYGYAPKSPRTREDVYHPLHNPFGLVPGEVAAEESNEYLRQSAKRNQHQERQSAERQAARMRRPR